MRELVEGGGLGIGVGDVRTSGGPVWAVRCCGGRAEDRSGVKIGLHTINITEDFEFISPFGQRSGVSMRHGDACCTGLLGSLEQAHYSDWLLEQEDSLLGRFVEVLYVSMLRFACTGSLWHLRERAFRR